MAGGRGAWTCYAANVCLTACACDSTTRNRNWGLNGLIDQSLYQYGGGVIVPDSRPRAL